jgi:hypothetical protein
MGAKKCNIHSGLQDEKNHKKEKSQKRKITKKKNHKKEKAQAYSEE